MSPHEIKKITRAYNKILAVLMDPDVQDVFRECHLLSQDTLLPEIQIGDLNKKFDR